MVLRADGSKYACHSCLKGHRVSACTHIDRELIFVPKKGRPVTQCQHCRLERKKRSAHVKCDCCETEKSHHPREKCIHLREAEERAKAGLHHDMPAHDNDAQHLISVAEEQGCCCHHGGKCSCSLMKREPSMKDSSSDELPHGPAVKPRLEKTSSDTSITVFSNGHHKPVHRKNHAAHECGMPYKVPMPRAHTEQSLPTSANRSHENLEMTAGNLFPSSGFSSASSTATFTANDFPSNTELSAPEMQATRSASSDGAFHGFDDLTQTRTNHSLASTTSEVMGYTVFDPLSGTPDGSYDPWSSYPSAESMAMSDVEGFPAWAMNDNFVMAQPALTAGSSGTQSEIDEIPPSDDFFNFDMSNMPSIEEDVSAAIPTTTAGSPQWNRRSLPAGFFGNVDFAAVGANNDAQVPNGVHPEDPKTRPQLPSTSNRFTDPWQMPGMVVAGNGNQRQAFFNVNGRPPSHSVGPSNAPSDDLIHQLFPDIDDQPNGTSSNGTTVFGSGVTGSPQEYSGYDRPDNRPVAATSAPAMNMTLMDDGSAEADAAGFTARPWSDGSLAIPNDTYSPSAYDPNPDFSTPDLDGAWADQ